MNVISTELGLEVTGNQEDFHNPTPPKINLSSCEDIRREMARVYREARSGKLPIGDATRLSYILVQIIKAHELMVLEKRINALESL